MNKKHFSNDEILTEDKELEASLNKMCNTILCSSEKSKQQHYTEIFNKISGIDRYSEE